MRHMLQHRAPFSSLRTVIKKHNKEMKDYDEMGALKFEAHIKNLILDSHKTRNRVQSISDKYHQICLTAAKPIQTLLKEFLNHSKSYSEEDLVETVVNMGRAFQISFMDHEGKLDAKEERLFQSPQFDHFIEEVKFGLSPHSYMSHANITKVIRALTLMKYPDIEIIKLVMLKIEAFLKVSQEESIDFIVRPYQGEKNNYYNPKTVGVDSALLQNEVFSKNLAYFQDKLKVLNEMNLAAKMSEEIGNDENYQNLLSLLENFSKFNKGAQNLVEAVIAIRQQYFKMCQISKEYQVLRNPSLNYDLLEVEEKLLEMGLITIKDVADPSTILNEETELAQVETIVRVLAERLKIENFDQMLVTTQKKTEYEKEKNELKIYEFSQMISALAHYCVLPNRLHGTSDKVSLLSVKWQRFFLQGKHYEHNLNVEKIFLKSFAETLLFFSANLPLIEFAIMSGETKSKMYWFDALLELGFYNDMIVQLKNLSINKATIDSFNQQEFFILIKILNHSLSSNIEISSQLHLKIAERLSIEVDSPQSHGKLTVDVLCNCINYLFQAGYSSGHALYDELVEKLEAEVQHYQDNEFFSASELREAYRILIFDRKDKDNLFGLDKALNSANYQTNNPFFQLAKQICLKNAFKTPEDVPFVLTGLNKDNEQTGLLLTPSDSSSLSGDHLSGHIVAYCGRVFKEYHIRLTPVSMNKFLTLSYSEPGKYSFAVSPTVEMVPEADVVEQLRKYQLKNNETLIRLVKSLATALSKLSAQSPSQTQFRINRILNTLKRLTVLQGRENDVTVMKEFFVKRVELIVAVFFFKRDLNIFTEGERKELNELFEKDNGGQNLDGLISQLETELEKQLPKQQERKKALSISENNILRGQRLTINLLDQTDVNVGTPELELIDSAYLADSSYVEYQDWKRLLSRSTTYQQISLKEASNLTNVLVRKYLPNIKDTIVALPTHKQGLYEAGYPVNWPNKYLRHEREQSGELQRLQQLSQKSKQINSYQQEEPRQNFISYLQDFKRELKMIKSPQQICQYILSFDFINNLLDRQDNGGDKAVNLISRDPKEYFNYLERKHDKMYLESPHLEYIFSKIEQTDILKEKIEWRKTMKVQAQMLFKRGSITKKQYFDRVKQMDESLIADMKGLKKKLVGHINGHQLLDDPRKIVTLEKNINELERVVNSAGYYDQSADEDLALAGGDYAEALNIKRAKAERNLILYRIFYKLDKGEALSESEKKYARDWQKSVLQPNAKPDPSRTFTSLTLKKLSGSDKEKIVLHSSNMIKTNSELALSDLILELNHFFDESVITKMEGHLFSAYFAQKKSIPPSAFLTTRNKEFNHLNHQVEGKIFDEYAKLTEQEINQMVELTKIFKTEGVGSRDRYKLFYGQVEADLQTINQTTFRNPLMKQYLRCKDFQFYREYFPQDVQQQKQNEVRKIWEDVFDKEIAHTSSSEIRKKVDDICKRMLAIRMSVPAYFGNFVLEILAHSKTDLETKEKLIAYIELFKVPLEIDSADLLKLAGQAQKKSQQALMEKMRQVSSKDFVGRVYELL